MHDLIGEWLGVAGAGPGAAVVVRRALLGVVGTVEPLLRRSDGE